jgi:hypothetical protein
LDGKQTCDIAEHADLENTFDAQWKASFQLQQILKQAGVMVPASSTEMIDDLELEIPIADYSTSMIYSSSLDDLTEATLPLVQQDQVPPLHTSEKADGGNRPLKAAFSRAQTHNKQLMVRPCGVIIACGTFFGSEGLYSVKVSTKSLSLPDMRLMVY